MFIKRYAENYKINFELIPVDLKQAKIEVSDIIPKSLVVMLVDDAFTKVLRLIFDEFGQQQFESLTFLGIQISFNQLHEATEVEIFKNVYISDYYFPFYDTEANYALTAEFEIYYGDYNLIFNSMTMAM